MKSARIRIETRAKEELIDITRRVQEEIDRLGIKQGICFVFVPHTTAGITINENADPSVKADILMQLSHIVPDRGPYSHLEGNAPAHIKASLLGSSVMVAVSDGRLQLGTWQGIMFAEFDGPRSRRADLFLLPQSQA